MATDEGLQVAGTAQCDALLSSIPHQALTFRMFFGFACEIVGVPSTKKNSMRRFASRTALPQGKPKISRTALPPKGKALRCFSQSKSGLPCGKPLLLYFAQSFGVGGVSSSAPPSASVSSRRAAAPRAAFCRRSASSASRRRFASAFSASERFERSLRSASISS